MKKSLLERFIAKYNLAGAVDGVTWTADTTGLSTEFVSDDKHVIGKIKTPNIKFDDGKYSIYETKAFRSLLGVLDDDITVSVNLTNNKPRSLSIKDDSTKVAFVLADPANIPGVATLKQLPLFENVITLDKTFVDRFIKSTAALVDVETFTLLSDGKKAEIVVGYDNNNTNRVTLSVVGTQLQKCDPIDFHARYMKEILMANREATVGKFEVASAGLARITFEIDDFEVVYYLPVVKREN